MANASPVHPLRPISAPRCSTLILFSTMKDNENRAQQQRTLYLCPTLSHCFCITRWCSPLIPPSGYLYPFLSLPHKHIWSGEECRLLNYSKSWQKVSLSVNSNESRFRSVYLWTGTKATALIISCLSSRCEWNNVSSFIGEDKLGRTKVIFWKGFFLLSCFPFQSVIVWSELKLYPPETVGSPFLDPTLFQPLAYQTELSPTQKFSDNSFWAAID